MQARLVVNEFIHLNYTASLPTSTSNKQDKYIPHWNKAKPATSPPPQQYLKTPSDSEGSNVKR